MQVQRTIDCIVVRALVEATLPMPLTMKDDENSGGSSAKYQVVGVEPDQLDGQELFVWLGKKRISGSPTWARTAQPASSRAGYESIVQLTRRPTARLAVHCTRPLQLLRSSRDDSRQWSLMPGAPGGGPARLAFFPGSFGRLHGR